MTIRPACPDCRQAGGRQGKFAVSISLPVIQDSGDFENSEKSTLLQKNNMLLLICEIFL